MSESLSVLPEKAEDLATRASGYRERKGPNAERRRFLAKMVAATGASLAWPADSPADTRLAFHPGSPASPEDESYWSRVRTQFAFEPNLIYFNNASLGV